MSRPFVNTNEFRRDALNFLKNGYYTDALPGTKDFFDYWDEQTRRCKEGYSVGGVHITGYHYFYLNFCQILLVPEDQRDNPTEQRKSASKIQSFPAFWDGDYEYYWAIEIARNGVSEDKYRKLGLETRIKHLKGGKHLVVLKARGKGYSYKTGSMLARNYQIGTKSKNFAIAEEKEYLIVDGLLNKVWDNIAFLDANTAWKQPRLKDTEMVKTCGYQQKTNTGYVERGRRNSIMGVTLKNNPDKARGKRGDLIFYEEAGKCPSLQQAWEINRPSVEQGAVTTGLMVAFGTGGTEDADYAGLEELFYHPDAYNVLPFENIWDEGGEGTSCSFFVPAYQNWEGFMDDDGNSDYEAAKAYLEAERENKKQAKDNSALDQYVSENPFTPREATLQVTQNLFPTAELAIHKNNVDAKKRYRTVPSGVLYESGEGVKFRPSQDPPPLYKFPLRKGDDERGAVCIVEAPVRIGGKIPENLYIVAHDPYAKDKTTGVSVGAAYVLKMTNNFSPTLNGCIVASYVGRPGTLDEYNRNLFMLAKYYNAKICFENNRGDVVGYAKRFRLLEYLMPEPEILQNKELLKQGNRSYGLTMNEERKNSGEIYLRDWLNTPLMTFEDGSQRLVLHTILDPALLQELIKFNRDGNFDRVMALMIGMFFMKDMSRREVVAQKESQFRKFMERKLFA